MFLLNGDSPPEDIKYLLNNIPPAYELKLFYLRALAFFSLNYYINEQVIALFFCICRLFRRAVKKLFDPI